MSGKTIAEQLAALKATRQDRNDKLQDITQKSIDENRSMNDAEAQEFEALEKEIDTLDADIGRLTRQEARMQATAKSIADDAKKNADRPANDGSRGTSFVQIKNTQKLQPGIRMARVVKCIGIARGNLMQAREIAESQYPDDEAVVNVLKAAVAAGTTSNATWAGALVGDETNVFADFVEFLRPQTIVGRFGEGDIPSLRRVPFRVPLIGQTSGGQGYWVGEGAPKPLTKFDFVRTTLEPLKVANIAVLTEEVVRDSSPSAEVIVRDQLVAALRERLDLDFVDPAKAASSGISPASVTNGVTPVPSSGSSADDVRCDIKALFETFIAANNAPTAGVWIMSATTALSLSLMQNPLGQAEFPGITMRGGTLFGLPVIVSEYVPSDSSGAVVILVNALDIYLSDEGGFMVDMSREASLQMDDAPTNNSATPTATQLVSLWQTNSVGFRAERTVNWAKRRPEAVALLSGVQWGICES